MKCPCGDDVPPGRKYCGRACASRFRSPETYRKMRENAMKSRLATIDDGLARFTKRTAYNLGRARGYQSARSTYHYERFLRRLVVALDTF